MSAEAQEEGHGRENVLGKEAAQGEAQDSKKPALSEERRSKGEVAEENLKRLSSLVKDMGLDLPWEVTEGFQLPRNQEICIFSRSL